MAERVVHLEQHDTGEHQAIDVGDGEAERGRRSREHEPLSLADRLVREQLLPLVPALEARDGRGQNRAAIILEPTADPVGRHYCGRLAHRGGFCSPNGLDASHAHGSVVLAVLRRLVGVAGRDRPAPRVLKWLADSAPCPLLTFAYRQMNAEEALRAWNAERGLVQRPRPEAWEALGLRVEDAIDAAGEHVRRVVKLLGFVPKDFFGWIEVGFWDNCQPSPTKIDADRQLRHATSKGLIRTDLLHEASAEGNVEQQLTLAVMRFAEFLDSFVRREDPVKYETYFVAPRSLTRPFDEGDGGGIVAPPVSTPPPSADGEQAMVRRLAEQVLVAEQLGERTLAQLLADPAVIGGSGFDAGELENLRALPETHVREMLRAVLRADEAA